MAWLSFLARRESGDDVADPDGGRFECGACTDKGPVRPANEDRYLDMSADGFWAVIDGMGGHRDGARAAEMVATALSSTPAAEKSDAIVRALQTVNAALHAEAKSGGVTGATVAVLAIAGDHYDCLWAGDCRIYRIRDGALTRLTKDHSEVNRLLEAGVISADEAATHPLRHVVTRAVGADAEIDIDLASGTVESGDVFLLATDGLEVVGEAALKAHCLGRGQNAAEALVRAAVANGATDNITAMVVRAR